MSDKTELFQPLLILPVVDATHEAVVTACARASVRAYLEDLEFHVMQFDWRGSLSDPWARWLMGRFTKSVRRLPSNFDISKLKLEDEMVTWIVTKHASVLACRPTTLETCSTLIRRAQVQGTDYRRTGEWPRSTGGPTIIINHALDMTTGKTAAQVAHGLFAWALGQARLPIHSEPLPFSIITTVNFDSIDADITINDAGLTEVEAGTATVKVVSSGKVPESGLSERSAKALGVKAPWVQIPPFPPKG